METIELALRTNRSGSQRLARIADEALGAVRPIWPVDPRRLAVALGFRVRPVCGIVDWRAVVLDGRIDYAWRDDLSESRLNAAIGLAVALLGRETEDRDAYQLAGRILVPQAYAQTCERSGHPYAPRWFVRAVLENRPRSGSFLRLIG